MKCQKKDTFVVKISHLLSRSFSRPASLLEIQRGLEQKEGGRYCPGRRSTQPRSSHQGGSLGPPGIHGLEGTRGGYELSLHWTFQ